MIKSVQKTSMGSRGVSSLRNIRLEDDRIPILIQSVKGEPVDKEWWWRSGGWKSLDKYRQRQGPWLFPTLW